MEKTLKYTIIVPVYKVEDYIERCVDSLISQSYVHLEIILVDDGSPDKCPFICDDFAKKDNRVKVLHKKNGGLSDARNAGIEQATGDYILFVDSDDWIMDDVISDINHIVQKYPADLYTMKAKKYYEDGTIEDRSNYFLSPGYYLIEDYHKLYVKRRRDYCPAAQFYIYSKSMLINNDLRFKKGLLHEDELWMVDVMLAVKRLYYTDCYYYNHFMRKGSIMHSNNYTSRSESLYKITDLCELKINSNTYEKYTTMYIKERISSLILKAYQLQTNSSIRVSRTIPFRYGHYYRTKIKGIIYCISPKLYYFISKKLSKERRT